MIPRTKRVTLTGRKIYNALLYFSQDRLVAMDGMPTADFMFSAPLQAILKVSGSSSETRTVAKRYLREMRGLTVDWETTAPGDGVKWKDFSMLAEAAIEVRNGENWVLWTFPPTLMTALKDPMRWARIDLGVLTKLSTYASVALYEICARYRDNPGGLTSRKPVAWWADALSPAPAGSERREWRKFKNEKIKAAVEEINAETELQIEMIEHKQGRSVFEVQFAVRKKRVATKPVEIPAPADADLVLAAESLGVSELKVEGLIKEFGEKAVNEKLSLLKKRMENEGLKKVENRYAYLRSLLRSPQADDEAAVLPSTPPAVAQKIVEINPEPAMSPQQVQGRATADWLQERRKFVANEIHKLDGLHREQLFQTVIQELTEMGLMTPVLKRRAAQGDMMHGALGVYSVNHYAKVLFGPDWNKPEADLFN
ncbi:RepB family plasmid replication initiator protein [Diaphorobacter caeni]|uniref:RepB family plasmid replication initiator protein n=1 Tax=Diaphorobacter caeni TaxID=2784387 RepID=UPI00188F2528|nr:RepB family plasmid replication initiator protein [Diaphorobacter caeni]MBF5007293.1 RepB family plasmid replication initiator protein [Diaphorobacter caeni]